MCGGLLPPRTRRGHLWEAGDGSPLQAHPEDQASHLLVPSLSMHSLGTYCVPGTVPGTRAQWGATGGLCPWNIPGGGGGGWIKLLGRPLEARDSVPDL